MPPPWSAVFPAMTLLVTTLAWLEAASFSQIAPPFPAGASLSTSELLTIENPPVASASA